MTSIPSNLIPRILLSNVLFVFSIYASKEWLLTYDVGIFWVLMRVLAYGGFGVLVWEAFTGQTSKRKTYEVSDLFFTAAYVDFVSGRCWVWRLYCSSCDMHACSRHYIDFPRHGKNVIYLYFIATLCLYLIQRHFIRSFPNLLDKFTTQSFYCKYFSSFNRTMKCLLPHALFQTRKALAVVAAIALAILSDTQLSLTNFWRYFSGYGVLFFYGLSSTALEHTLGVLSPALGTNFSTAAATLGATLFALPFYVFRSAVVCPIYPFDLYSN